MDDLTHTLKIEIIEEDADPQQLDEVTRTVRNRISDLDVEFPPQPAPAPAETGAKGDALTIGSVFLEAASHVIPGLFNLISQLTGSNRKIVVKSSNGTEIEFFADKQYSPDEIADFVNKINKPNPES